MYKNIQTPNSPLSPLSPLPPCNQPSEYMMEKMSNHQFLTPSYQLSQKHNKRRSFTPNAFSNDVSPPSVSPIRTVFESSESDLENSAIFEKPVSSAAKLVELFNTPPQFFNLLDRKSHSCTVNRKASDKVRRAYHCQRKYENRPNIKIDITSLRRSLYETLQSPSMSEEDQQKKTVTWNDSPMMFEKNSNPVSNVVRSKTLKHSKDSNPTPKSRPKISLPSVYYSKIDEESSLYMNNNSILNNNFTVDSVLKDIGMEKYIEKFRLEEIDLFVFFNLQPEDLHELNIDEKDHETLLQAIKVFAV